jgi:Ca2+/Na+ antiporter
MNVIERLLFEESYSFLLVCVILIFLFLFPQFSGVKENKVLIKYRISPRLFILFMLILVILMHYGLSL